MLFSAYSLLFLLLRFEFYVMYKDKYEQYIQNEINDDNLESVFIEASLIQRDINFLTLRFPDLINLGVIIVDVKEFKDIILKEI